MSAPPQLDNILHRALFSLLRNSERYPQLDNILPRALFSLLRNSETIVLIYRFIYDKQQ